MGSVTGLSKERAGSEVMIECTVRDRLVTPPVLFSPDTVKLTLYKANGTTVAVNDLAMTEISTGKFRYRYQTSTSDTAGPWTGYFKATEGSVVVYSRTFELFELVSS